MKGYIVNIELEANRYVSEEIKLVEVPVNVFDNRDEKEHQIVCFLVDDGEEYCIDNKVRKICEQLGYTVLLIDSSAKMVRKVDAGMVFLGSGK